MSIQVGSWVDAIAAFAEDNGYSNLYVGRRSDDSSLPNRAIIFTETQGRVDEAMGFGGDVLRPGVNVYHRGDPDDYPGSRDTIHGLAALLPMIVGVTIHGWPFIRVGGDAMTTPTPLGSDANRRFEWSLDLPVWMPQGTLPTPTFNP